MVQVSASLHRKLQSSRLSALGAAGTCKPGGNKDLPPCQRKEVSMGLNSPFLWRGLWICLEEGEGYTHWSCARVWRRHGDPRLRPQTGGAQVITEVMCCESGKKLVSSVSSAGHQPYPDQTVPPKEVCPPPACEGAGGHKMLRVPGTLLPAPRAPQPNQLLPQRLSERLSAGLVWTPAR